MFVSLVEKLEIGESSLVYEWTNGVCSGRFTGSCLARAGQV